ncbi:MAG: Fic family protein [Bacilli bacterium]|nr:Fic family protein [Bacilli bacterium]
MIIEKFNEILSKQLEAEYYTAKEMQYGNNAGTFLSPFEYKEYLEEKDLKADFDNKYITKLPLKTFNFKCIYYCLGIELQSAIEMVFNWENSEVFSIGRFSNSFLESRIYSEIEGTLNVENVPTTRRRLKELLEDNAPSKDKNDIIIKNMKEGIDFVNALPEFNRDNLFKLYSILSKDCLEEDDKLRIGDYYRYDTVEISRYHGCPHNLVDECMDSLFSYVNELLNAKKTDKYLMMMLPHICHYYIIYIHPYFDYNGRTARMVSYWIYLLTGLKNFPSFVSEAVNQTKNKYYKAIENTRDSHNDLTYFLIYLFNITNDYALAYENLVNIEKEAKTKGYIVTETEINYMKKILISYEGVFSYTDFLKTVNVEMSKQGALKILNKFVDFGFLKETESKSKTKLFDINKDAIAYSLKHLGVK